jgi:hypothetical protein
MSFKIDKDTPYHFEEISFETGETSKMSVNGNEAAVRFKPFELRALRLTEGEYTVEDEELPEFVIDVSGEMDVSVEGENNLMFNTFGFSTDNNIWEVVDVSTAENQIDAAGFMGGGGLAQINKGGFGMPKSVSLTYPKTLYYKKEFNCEFVPNSAGILMDESTIMQGFEMTLNGVKIEREQFTKCFVNDIKNIRAPVDGLLRVGGNELLITVTAENGWGGIRDNIYITGDFSVVKDDVGGFRITKPSGRARINKTYIEGYPFYCGTFSFKTEIQNKAAGRYTVSLSERGLYDCLELIINGKGAGVRAFAPYEWEAEISKGLNEVEIRITNTLIGMLEGAYFDYDRHETVTI